METGNRFHRARLDLVALALCSAGFTYVKRIGSRNEYIVRRGHTEIVLSRNWPAEMLWPFPED